MVETRCLLVGSVFLDLVDPLMVPSVLFFELIVVLLESAVIYLLLMRKAVRAFAASFSANLVTSLLSVLYLLLPRAFVSTYSNLALSVVTALLINILLEAGVLRHFCRGVSFKKILKISTVMNVASYAIVIYEYLYIVGSW